MGLDILVVDDDVGSRDALTRLLTDEGYEVAGAANGIEAFDYLRRSPPRLIIFDLMMPVLDGWEFREQQRKDPALARIPVIATSAALRIVDADAFFRKPIDVGKLLSTVSTFLERGN
jgi:CheY-like chemotaxis protein